MAMHLEFGRGQNVCVRYHNFPKFSDRQVWANSADPDQTALIRVYTVCHSVCIIWTQSHIVQIEWLQQIFLGLGIFRKFTVFTDYTVWTLNEPSKVSRIYFWEPSPMHTPTSIQTSPYYPIIMWNNIHSKLSLAYCSSVPFETGSERTVACEKIRLYVCSYCLSGDYFFCKWASSWEKVLIIKANSNGSGEPVHLHSRQSLCCPFSLTHNQCCPGGALIGAKIADWMSYNLAGREK